MGGARAIANCVAKEPEDQMTFLRTVMFGVLTMAAFLLPSAAETQKGVYKVALHVDDNDAAKMNLTLNNVQNIIRDFKKSGKKIEIEVVTYGPGLHMFRADTSPVKARIEEIALANPNVTFSACGNTQSKMAKAEKKPINLIHEAKLVPSGIVRLIELQRQGYAYVKP
jgi:intracellular sulfur oxidation DsrE/DsrF family protein